MTEQTIPANAEGLSNDATGTPVARGSRLAQFLAKWRTLTEAEKWALIAKLDEKEVA